VPNSHSGESGNVSGVFMVVKWGVMGWYGCGVVKKLILHDKVLKVWNYTVVECVGDVKGKTGIEMYLYLESYFFVFVSA